MPHPHVEPIQVQAQTHTVSGPAVLWVRCGEASLRDHEEVHVRLRAGDLCTLSSRVSARIGDVHADATILAFRPSQDWVRHARGFAGLVRGRRAPGVFAHRAGSDVARRGGRILRELLQRGQEDLDPLERAARQLELLALVFAPRSGFVDPRPRESRRARARRGGLLSVVEQLEHEPLEGVSLATLAHRLNTSERQVSRLFRSELSTTFREFMSELRLKRARHLLRSTDLPVIDVAAETGWRSLGHFTTTFRTRVGMTPSAYRRQEAGIREVEQGPDGGGEWAA